MINKEHGRVSLVCDECEEFESDQYDDDDFNTMIQDAKFLGWFITQDEGEWKHMCSDCADKLPKLG